MEEDDSAELDAMLGSLSSGAARIASDALFGVLEPAAANPIQPNANLDWIVQAIADVLARRSGRRTLSANQIAAAVARAVQRGARFT